MGCCLVDTKVQWKVQWLDLIKAAVTDVSWVYRWVVVKVETLAEDWAQL